MHSTIFCFTTTDTVNQFTASELFEMMPSGVDYVDDVPEDYKEDLVTSVFSPFARSIAKTGKGFSILLNKDKVEKYLEKKLIVIKEQANSLSLEKLKTDVLALRRLSWTVTDDYGAKVIEESDPCIQNFDDFILEMYGRGESEILVTDVFDYHF